MSDPLRVETSFLHEHQIVVYEEPEGMWVRAPDMPGWTAAACCWDQLRRLVSEAVELWAGEDGCTSWFWWTTYTPKDNGAQEGEA